MKITRRILRPVAALGSGLGVGLAQPDWGIWPLAFIALVPAFWAMNGVGFRGRIALGWWLGTAATMTTPWLPGAEGFSSYFGLSGLAGGLAALAVAQLFGAGSMMFFAGLAGDGGGGAVRGALRMAGAWIAAEWLRATLFTGLPWMLLAYSLQPVPHLAQLASIGGVLTVSGALVLCNAATAHLFNGSPRKAVWTVWAIGLALLVVPMSRTLGPISEGQVVLDPKGMKTGTGSTLRVSLVQGAFPADRRYQPGGTAEALGRLASETRALGPADLVVWPESSMNAVWPENQHVLVHAMRSMATSWLLFGAPRAENGRVYNSAVLVGPGAVPSGAHDKVRLLPFAERFPWPFSLRPGDLSAGDSARGLDLGTTRIGPLICYEILFEDLARYQVSQGAGILVNLSNEAWFYSKRAMRQNLAAAVFRSIELNRPILRATNTGLTAAIDSRGRVVAQLPPERLGGLAVRVRPASEHTVYYRFGYAIPAAISIWVAVLATVRALKGRAGS